MNSSTVVGLGVDADDRDGSLKALDHLDQTSETADPRAVMDALIRIVQQLHVTSNSNNIILNQLLSDMEKRIEQRISSVKAELSEIILSRLVPVVKRTDSSTRRASSTAIGPSVSDKKSDDAVRRTTLSRIFDGIESHTPGKPVAQSVTVTPLAGFVIKTRKLLGNKEKAFINVFFDEGVELDAPNDALPLVYFANISSVLDKEGHNCVIYNVVVSAEYFKQNTEISNRITSTSYVQKIIHKVNIKYNDFLDEANFSLPRSSSGFKGDAVPQFEIPSKACIASSPSPALSSNHSANLMSKSSFVSLASDSGLQDSDSIISDISVEPVRPFGAAEKALNGSSAYNQWEVESVTSTGSVARRASNSKKKIPRKSIFDTSQMAMNEGTVAGRNMLTEDMLAFMKEESVDNHEAETLKVASVENPTVLLGWQISMVDSANKTDVYVITGVRKNYMSKTEFRVSKFAVEDAWVRLKRGEGKSGLVFRPLRKVLNGLTDDSSFNHRG
eukprot:gene1319-1441_t